MRKYTISNLRNIIATLCPPKRYWRSGMLDLIFHRPFRALLWILELFVVPPATMAGWYGLQSVVGHCSLFFHALNFVHCLLGTRTSSVEESLSRKSAATRAACIRYA
jgi:hypothetical protein